MREFEPINRAYNSVFQPGKLSLGLVVPVESYPRSPVPIMRDHLERVQLAEQLGFKAVWLRDVPLHVPSFGDAGQTFDPFTYLGYLAAATSSIGLGIASIALPLHHPLHIAKSATTVDQLSDGRMILGVASGDRPDEYPAMGIDFESRGELFRDAFDFIRKAQEPFPGKLSNHFGSLKGQFDILPKAKGRRTPMLITGFSRQTMEWNAQYGDGWMNYPRNPLQQQFTIEKWRSLISPSHGYDKPFMQPLYVDLMEDDDFKPEPIHLGLRLGANYLNAYLHQLQVNGVNHVALNLRFHSGAIEEALEQLAAKVLPGFH